ncbi:MAG: beta-lactamase superfamily domain protein [Firmicutes bacterium]|nr:beta-lactamase superfamily domain protein [Bacillota bacterium]
MTTIYFLGTSDAQGVPRLGCTCQVCTSHNNKNNRSRSSLLVSEASSQLLIDISPDFRMQFMPISYRMQVIPDVLVTHVHYDHIGGLGDFSDLCFWQNGDARIISPNDVSDDLTGRYGYVKHRKGVTFCAQTFWDWGCWSVEFHRVNHGHNGYSYGMIFKKSNYKWGYFPDAIDLSPQEMEPMRGCDLLILGTTFWEERTAFCMRSVHDVQEALVLKEKLEIREMILTHLSHDIEYDHHSAMLPRGVTFAYDGRQVTLE